MALLFPVPSIKSICPGRWQLSSPFDTSVTSARSIAVMMMMPTRPPSCWVAKESIKMTKMSLLRMITAAAAVMFAAESANAEKVLKLGTVGRLGMPIGDAIDQAMIPALKKASGGKLKIEPHYQGSLCGEQ
ncbi:MAG: hypothetical protein ACI9XZ_000001, partial [Alphaproteobacteria bacterium]